MKSKTSGYPGNIPKTSKADQPQAQMLADLGRDAELFHTPQGETWATIPVSTHQENWPIRHKRFRLWLIDRFDQTYGKPPSSQALTDALSVFEAKAQLRSPKRSVFVRVGQADGAIYLDLANDSWLVVEITPSGWHVRARPPVCFRRPNGMQALPCPVEGGSIEALRPLLNLPDDDSWRLVVGWLLGALRPNGPYPLLVLQGEQGSAKSTTARVLRRLIDPATSPLRTVPPGERELMISAINAHALSFDNLSGLSPWLSDALCRLSTGGGFATRELYTNTEETILDAMRPVILNGIDDLAIRQDLVDRSIVLRHPTISESARRPESEFWKAFERVHPEILGALCTAMVTALARYSGITLASVPRMADFSQWVAAAAPALGWSAEDFLSTYTRNRREAVEIGLEASLVAGLVRSLLERRGEWRGTVSQLLNEFRLIAAETEHHSRAWPQGAHALGSHLQRLTPALRTVGILVERHREGGSGQRLIVIRKTSENSVTAVTPVTSPQAEATAVTSVTAVTANQDFNLAGPQDVTWLPEKALCDQGTNSAPNACREVSGTGINLIPVDSPLGRDENRA